MKNLPKDFALQLGSLLTLYISLAAFLSLIFAMVNIAMPDAADQYWQLSNNQDTLKFSLSCLIVFFPAYLCITRKVNKRRRSEVASYTVVTKWLIYLSLLVGGLVMLGDLVAIVHTYLNGEITPRFIVKAISMLLILGLIFYYYLLDAKGYWVNHEQYSLMYSAVATFIVVGMMAASLYHIETPAETREKRLDAIQVSDIQDIYFNIDQYHSINGYLPESMDGPYEPGTAPRAPQDRRDYEYIITDDHDIQLCAEFAFAADAGGHRPSLVFDHQNSSYHGAGFWCYDFSIKH